MSMREDDDRDNIAYITIVEGPPPDFRPASHQWTASLAEGPNWTAVASCEMRTFNGKGLVERCRKAWQAGRPARLDYPIQTAPYAPKSGRAEVEIVAARWRDIQEGQVLTLWIRTDNAEEIGADEEEPD
jgi:hypothetical protein